MKLNELMNGDIVVQRGGELGLVQINAEGETAIIYQTEGFDMAGEEYNDDMTDLSEPEFDIMQVYREPNGTISFSDYDEGDLIYERDETWVRLEKEVREAARAERVARRAAWEAEMMEKAQAARAAQKKTLLRVMVQGFYGNRTGTEIRPEEFDAFMLGYLDTGSFDPEREAVDRTIIHVPGTENLVIVYNRYQEAESLEHLQRFIQELKQSESRYNATAVIPELGIVLYSRCIVGRMDDAGELMSMEEEDDEKVLPYLAQ